MTPLPPVKPSRWELLAVPGLCMHNPSYVDLPEGPRLMVSRGSHDTMKSALTFAVVDRAFNGLCRAVVAPVPSRCPHDPRLFFESADDGPSGRLAVVFAYMRNEERLPRDLRWGQAIATVRYGLDPFSVAVENVRAYPMPEAETSHKNLIPHDGVWLYHPQHQVIRDGRGRLLHQAPPLPVELRGGAIPTRWGEHLFTAYHTSEPRPDGKRDYRAYIALLGSDFPYPLKGYRKIDASDLHALGLRIKDQWAVRRVNEVLFPTTVNAAGKDGEVTVLCGLQDGHAVELSIARDHVAEMTREASEDAGQPQQVRRRERWPETSQTRPWRSETA